MKTNYWNAYGVYCITINANLKSEFLDRQWEEAIDIYEDYLKSKYNDENKSELECINDYLKTL